IKIPILPYRSLHGSVPFTPFNFGQGLRREGTGARRTRTRSSRSRSCQARRGQGPSAHATPTKRPRMGCFVQGKWGRSRCACWSRAAPLAWGKAVMTELFAEKELARFRAGLLFLARTRFRIASQAAEDLVQSAIVTFLEVRDRYPKREEHP